MDTLWRTRMGYFAFGLLIGLFIFPWIFVPATREQWAVVSDPTWAAVWFAVVLGPAVLAMLVGWNKGRGAAA